MTFRQRLYAFFAIIVVAPAAAVAVVGLTASVGDRADEIDARLAQGFRTAFVLYDEARTAARPALRRVASDQDLGRALRAGRFEEADERLELLVEREPEVRSIVFRDRSGRAVAEAGTPDALAAAAAALARGDAARLVVCTGGEPLLQLDAPLIAAFKAQGFEIAVESNGTLPAPEGIDWICISPKGTAPVVQTSGQELKLVFPQAEAPPERFACLAFERFYLQPMDGPDRERNTQAAIAYCLENPRWRLSVQTHKYLGFA